MTTFDLLVVFPKTFKNTKNLTLSDMLGHEFEPYYGGSGFNFKTGDRDFFFSGIPDRLIPLISKRLEDGNCKYEITRSK